MKIRPMGAGLFLGDRRTDEQTGRHGEANIYFTRLFNEKDVK